MTVMEEAERIMASTDEEILAEVRANGEDPLAVAADVLRILGKAKAQVSSKAILENSPCCSTCADPDRGAAEEV